MHLQQYPQMQATKQIDDFVTEEDGVGKLLVVYYAGHGRAGRNGQLVLSGSLSTPQDEDEDEDGGNTTADEAENASIDWSTIETATLAKTSADVLVIFDCCAAGLLDARSPSLPFHQAAPAVREGNSYMLPLVKLISALRVGGRHLSRWRWFGLWRGWQWRTNLVLLSGGLSGR